MSSAAGAVLREARQAAGLSQAELARRAGVAQSVISAYENGRREPGMGMLAKLVEAAGHSLRVEAVAVSGATRGLPHTALGGRLRRRRRAMIEAAARRGARNIRVFGSAARGTDTELSDVDLLVDLDPDVGLVTLIALERELSEILGRDVEVVPAAGLKPALAAEILAEAIPL
jgi:predicted nucleotidyltransferase/DNA-binding XRE family transcriptional regulator